MKKTALQIIIAVLIGVPLGWIAAMASTPLLWKLEPILGLELAGHSGPSDWIFYVAFVICSGLLYWIIRKANASR